MSIPTTLVVSMSASLGGNILRKHYANKASSGNLSVYIFNAISSFAAAITFLVWGGFGDASVFTLLLGALFGAVVMLQGLFFLKAMQIGPMSLTMVIVTFSTVITALSGAVFWGETIKILQIVGIILMFASFYFTVDKKQDEKSASLKWLVLCLLALIFFGGIGLMQKIHQTSAYKLEINAFLTTAFIVGGILSLIFTFASKAKTNGAMFVKTETGRISWVVILIMVVAGVCTATNHKLNLYLSGVMDSAVFFPLINGGGLVLVTLSALVIFRERLTIKQWISVALGIASVLCLCL